MSNYQGRRPEDSDYGLGEHFIDCDELGILDEKRLAARLVRTFESPSYHPPRLPAVATELLALSKQTDVAYEAVEALLEQDPVLAGEVLAVARSAYYSRQVPVESLHDALVRLGVEKLRDIVFQAAMNLRVFRSTAYRDCMDRLRLHCQATAHLTQIVSLYTPLAGERGFLCGLLHDVGYAGVLMVLGEVERGQKPPELDPMWPSIDAVHAKVGARLASLWRLPAEIATAVGAHHQVTIDGQEHPLAALVCVAEALAVELELDFRPPVVRSGAKAREAAAGIPQNPVDRSDAMTVRRAHKALAIDEPRLKLIREAAREWAGSFSAATAGGRK